MTEPTDGTALDQAEDKLVIKPPAEPLVKTDAELIRELRAQRALKGEVKHVDVAPAVKLDLGVLMPGVAFHVDEFIAERQAAGKPLPDKQAMLDRAQNLLANVDPTKLVGTNGLGGSKRLTLHHSDEPPFFKIGTSEG